MASQSSDGLTCGRVLDLLEQHLDGELNEAVEAEITAHTDHCSDCAAELDLALNIRREFERLPRFDTPLDLIARARERTPEAHLRSGAVPSGSTIHRPWAAVLAAAAAVAIAASVVLLRPDPPPEPPTADPVAVDRTQTEAKLAFALIADATRRAEHELMEGVLKERVLGVAVKGISRSFEFANRPDREREASPIPHPTPKEGGIT